MTTTSDQFLELFSHQAPALRVKWCITDQQAKTIRVEHRLGGEADASSHEFLNSIGSNPEMQDFVKFYHQHNGAELCRTHDARHGQEKPLIEFKTARSIAAFTNRYVPGGDRDWIIDLNKSKALYRGAASWIAFAEINSGPMCLTVFLEGENAGCVYFATPQPAFNILRPIAKGFEPLLHRVARDLPAFLRLVRATVALRGQDGQNYGFTPSDYIANVKQGT